MNDSSESEVSSVVPEINSITCDGTFKFSKVGKASPSLEFTTILRLDKNVPLSDLHSDLVKQHLVGVDIFRKFPAYDVHIHVVKKDKRCSAHTPQQWQEIRELLTRGLSMIGRTIRYDIFFLCL